MPRMIIIKNQVFIVITYKKTQKVTVNNIFFPKSEERKNVHGQHQCVAYDRGKSHRYISLPRKCRISHWQRRRFKLFAIFTIYLASLFMRKHSSVNRRKIAMEKRTTHAPNVEAEELMKCNLWVVKVIRHWQMTRDHAQSQNRCVFFCFNAPANAEPCTLNSPHSPFSSPHPVNPLHVH